MQFTEACLIAALTLVGLPFTIAAQESRKATLEDISGVKTEVAGFWCEGVRAFPYRRTGPQIRIQMGSGFVVYIPVNRVRTITLNSGTASVTYDWQGQTRTTNGKAYGNCGGASEFGPLQLDVFRIRKVTFSSPPTIEPETIDLPPADWQATRAASIETTGGLKFDGTMLNCEGMHGHFLSSFHIGERSAAYVGGDFRTGIILRTKYFSAGIHMARLRSIKALTSTRSSSGQGSRSVEVSYDYRGRTHTLVGQLDERFYGESDLGYFELDISSLRQINFSTPPSAAWPVDEAYVQTGADPATVTLVDGMRMALIGFRRSTTAYSKAGYIVGGEFKTDNCTYFSFMRGDSVARAEFRAIAKLEFGPEGSVTVTMRSGGSTPGRLTKGESESPTNWTGESELGWISLLPESVRVIEFGDPSKFK